MQKRVTTKKASVLVFAMIILLMLLVSGIAVITVATVERQSVFATERSVVAFQAANSGAERVLKRIYIDDSPSVASFGLGLDLKDATPRGDSTLADLTGHMTKVDHEKCFNGTITANNKDGPDYSFEITFLDKDGNNIGCGDTTWRDNVIHIRSVGYYRNTSRLLDIGIRPRE